jgi:protein-ribulosamine 3-kinase
MPLEIKEFLGKTLSGIPGLPPAGELFIRQVGGGSINATYQLSTKNNSRWFCKFNDARQFPDLFAKEANGLALLRQQLIIRIPATIACLQAAHHQILLLEWIEEGPKTTGFWRLFGEQLAALHRAATPHLSPEGRPLFGLEEDNYMGALPQDNTHSPGWTEFFARRRLEPQIRLAADSGLLDNTAIRHFERLYSRLPDFFPPEPPALLHGDLWSGNFLCDTAGRPVLIDPAVYYGHRSIDLAMTTLFGGFEKLFYEAYDYHYPLPPGYQQQWVICNLYPLLIHLNLFGHAYLPNILTTIQRF